MKARILLVWISIGLMTCISFSCGKGNRHALYQEIDSLNKRAYHLHYINLEQSAALAEEAFQRSKDFPSQHAAALNNKAFCTFMQMDFDKAEQQLKQIYGITNNELELLIADIGLMKIYQRISMNKEFYDYRTSALQRMRRIKDDSLSISYPDEWQRFNYAQTEFSITSGVYYYYLQQEEQSLEEINQIQENNALRNDTAQLLLYYYMRGSGGMYAAETPQDVTLGEFFYLLECYNIAKDQGYIYFEANSLQAFAELLMDEKNYALISERRPNLLRLINTKDLPWNELILSMANEALQLFKQYGDMYQISGSYRTLASCCNALGKYDEALKYLTEALEYVNKHHEKYYASKGPNDRLRTFVPNSTESTELAWNKEGIKTVHEWITRLREQLSVTYAALGMKQESDYNRNIYLDLLNYTRQDKELESHFMALEKESSQLNLLMTLVGLSGILFILIFLMLYRLWKKRNTAYIEKLKKTLEICQRITASIPVEANDMEDVTTSILRNVKDDILRLVDGKELKIRITDQTEEEEDADKSHLILQRYPLTASTNKHSLGEVELYTTTRLKSDNRDLMKIITPYIAWALENGQTFISLGDEQKMLEKERYVHQQHLIENKQQNIVKKACLFIVTSITPYIDRINNEVHKLIALDYLHNDRIKQEKYTYINELVNSINENNDILSLWIKMRQGSLNLNVENFELNPLFEIVSKNRKSFEIKQQQLTITPTSSIVKADKALTLFMINTLMDNARKYTPKGGKIEVFAKEMDNYVEISIQDNGPGLSEEDRSHILHEKVYDSQKIGMQGEGDLNDLQKNKGYGFGLMNCKGIIEKYKKTNPLFNVCSFDIDSRLGEGSRFFFRLPKGIRKVMYFVLLLLLPCFMACMEDYSETSSQALSEADSIQYNDQWLDMADKYANLTYESNLGGAYEEAVAYADTALIYLNEHYRIYSKKDGPLATLKGEGPTAELTWLNDHFLTDYYIFLDVRNEAAVAFLALKDFENYRYNNVAYTALYKQISKDTSLEQYCQRMQNSSNGKTIAIAMFIAFFIAFIIGYYILYFRHRLTYRYDLQQILEINKQVFKTPASITQTEHRDRQIVDELIQAVSEGMNEIITTDRIGLMVFNEEDNSSHTAFSPAQNEAVENDEMLDMMNKCYQSQKALWTEGNKIKCLPMWVEAGNENHCVGVLAIQYTYDNERANDRLLIELVASYIAIIAYNAIVLMTRKYQDIESAQDEANRAIHEENQLHVQNQVLDNCLSTIKHETIYYPNRIKQIIEKLQTQKDVVKEEEDVRMVEELVGYYKDIFMILSSCAAKQLEDITFRREILHSELLGEYILNYFKRKMKKQAVDITFSVHYDDVYFYGDEIQLKYLLENLVNEALSYQVEGQLSLHIYKERDFVRFDFTDSRRNKTQEELNLLFNPHLSHIHEENEDVLTGTEYLICKQVIREHDEYTGKRGCRINAQAAQPEGFTVWFTIPAATHRHKITKQYE